MNLQVTELKIGKVSPAQIEWNGAEIKASLDVALENCRNTVVTEETLKGSKKTMAELNKQAKAIDDFRKTTVKNLNPDIKKFESEAKELVTMIKEARTVISDQADKFEADRKAKKESDVAILISTCKEESTLRDEYKDRIELLDSYLNATMTLTKIKADIEQQLSVLAVEQQSFDNKVDTVKAFIDILNDTYALQVPLDYENFSHLISLDVSELKTKVEELAQRRQKQEFEAAERIRLEAERQAKEEADRIIAEEKAKQQAELDRIEAEKQAEINRRVQEETKAVKEEAEQQIEKAETVANISNSFMPVESEIEEPRMDRFYALLGTAEEFEALDRYLEASGIEVQ